MPDLPIENGLFFMALEAPNRLGDIHFETERGIRDPEIGDTFEVVAGKKRYQARVSAIRVLGNDRFEVYAVINDNG